MSCITRNANPKKQPEPLRTRTYSLTKSKNKTRLNKNKSNHESCDRYVVNRMKRGKLCLNSTPNSLLISLLQSELATWPMALPTCSNAIQSRRIQTTRYLPLNLSLVSWSHANLSRMLSPSSPYRKLSLQRICSSFVFLLLPSNNLWTTILKTWRPLQSW